MAQQHHPWYPLLELAYDEKHRAKMLDEHTEICYIWHDLIFFQNCMELVLSSDRVTTFMCVMLLSLLASIAGLLYLAIKLAAMLYDNYHISYSDLILFNNLVFYFLVQTIIVS